MKKSNSKYKISDNFIAFEYDEPKHYIDKENNILRDYDIHRMKRIKEILGCEFYRYNEYLNLLYKI